MMCQCQAESQGFIHICAFCATSSKVNQAHCQLVVVSAGPEHTMLPILSNAIMLSNDVLVAIVIWNTHSESDIGIGAQFLSMQG